MGTIRNMRKGLGAWTQKGKEKFKAHKAVIQRQSMLTVTRTWEDKEQMSPRAFRGHADTLVSDFDLQSCERIDLYCFKPLNL